MIAYPASTYKGYDGSESNGDLNRGTLMGCQSYLLLVDYPPRILTRNLQIDRPDARQADDNAREYATFMDT